MSAEMQKAFAVELVSNGGNVTQAAISAGYSPKSARQIGQHLLDKQYVQKMIRREQNRVLGGRLANKALSVLEGILDDPEAPYGARVDAAKTVLDRAGLPAIPAALVGRAADMDGLNLVELDPDRLWEMLAQLEAELRECEEEDDEAGHDPAEGRVAGGMQ